MRTYDVAIVGAGIVGAACAAALANEGLSVVLIDKSSPATGSTAAGMGHIVVMDDSEAQFALTSYSQRLWQDLSLLMPANCEYEQSGTIWVAVDDDEMAQVRQKNEFYDTRGIPAEVLDQQSLREAEPNLSEDLIGGLLVCNDKVVYQLAATDFLVESACRLGTELRRGVAVKSITDGRVLLESGEVIRAGSIINAAGAAAADLSPQLKIRRRKGHLVITDRCPGFIRHQLVELGYLRSAHGAELSSVAFNVQPRRTDQVLLGSSRQFDADDDKVDHTVLSQMTSRAFEYMPKLRQLSAVRVWTGFRPTTPDNLPYIGGISEGSKIYTAAGHEGLGITTSLGTAALLTDLLLERPTRIPAGPYSPNRAFTQH